MSKKIVRRMYRTAYVTGVALLVASMVLGVAPTSTAKAAIGSGSIWTNTGPCGNPQNVNEYFLWDWVWIHGANFDASTTYLFRIIGTPGSSDPNITVASTLVSTDANGDFCIENVYQIQPGDDGVYKFGVCEIAAGKVNCKNDNYHVDAITITDTPTNTPPPPTDTPTNTPTNTPLPTFTDTPTSTNTPTDTPTNTPTNTATNTPTGTPPPTDTPTSTPTDTPTNTPTPLPRFSFTDPCQVGCGLPSAVSRLCNISDSDYHGQIEWSATYNGQPYPDDLLAPNSPIEGLAANTCVDLRVPRLGNGVYAFDVFIVSLELELDARCGLSCASRTTPTPVEPPEGEPGVLIPVTGFDYLEDSGYTGSVLRNLGFGFLSLGLVLQGFSLRMKDEEEDA